MPGCEKKTVLISACLLGLKTRYDGRSKEYEALAGLMEKYNLIPVCPEVMGGLPTPRVPSERVGERVIMRDGNDVTENYMRGATEVLKLARLYGADTAILTERSPACGSGKIYDGSFTGTLTDGFGVCAEYLIKNGVRVIGSLHLEELSE